VILEKREKYRVFRMVNNRRQNKNLRNIQIKILF